MRAMPATNPARLEYLALSLLPVFFENLDPRGINPNAMKIDILLMKY